MDAPPSLETVLQALAALYHGNDTGGKEKASLWLGELQKSIYAWQISDQLLQLNQDVESCYFAAQTMRTKIQYSFEELPLTSHQSLRDSLLNHCKKINLETPQVIVTQLCLALADLVLQMSTWKNAAMELIQQFAGNVQYWTFLVELLSLLPEERPDICGPAGILSLFACMLLGSRLHRALRLGSNRRNEIAKELEQSAVLLLQLLTTVNAAAPDSSRVQAQVLHCLGSWLGIAAIPAELVIASTLIQLPFVALSNKDCPSHLHHAATECVSSTLLAIENVEQNTFLAKTLLDGVLCLTEAYHMSVALEDLDKSMNYSRIFTDMAETFLPQMIEMPNQGFGDFRTLDLLLTCVGHHHYEVADVTFTFWNRLSETLYDGCRDEVCQLFSPYVQRLIVALARHCQFDSSMESIPEEEGDFDEFRKRSADVVSDFVFMVEADDVVCQMFETLKGVDGKGAPWEVSEAALFIMCAVAKRVSCNKENPVIPELMMVILGQPMTTHMAVRYTSTRLIGELRDWINYHPDVLEPVLRFLLSGLQESKLGAVAADSLQSICYRCSERMSAHFDGLLDIVKAIDTYSVPNDAVTGLLKGAAHILSVLPWDRLSEGLRQLCSVQVEGLSKLINRTDTTKVVTGTKDLDPVIWLDRLAVIFRCTNIKVENGQQHPCQEVILQIWPLLSQAFYKYSHDTKIVERCCRCVRFAIRCLGSGCPVLLQPLVNQIVILYEIYPHSCCLYLGSILVDEYGSLPDCSPLLLSMLQSFYIRAFKILDEAKALRNHPDTVDDLFRLCYRCMQKMPVGFLQCEAIKSIVVCSIACCCLDHKEANSSVSTFLTEFIRSARDKDNSSDTEVRRSLSSALLAENGQAIISGLLKAVLFCLPTYMHPDMAEILFEFMRIDRPSVCRWLETELKSLPTQSAGGAVTATHEQLAEFHKTVTSAEDFKQVSKAFRDFSRLFR